MITMIIINKIKTKNNYNYKEQVQL